MTVELTFFHEFEVGTILNDSRNQLLIVKTQQTAFSFKVLAYVIHRPDIKIWFRIQTFFVMWYYKIFK